MKYYRLMLGRGSQFAERCFAENFIGADYSINQDLTNALPEKWRDFNAQFIPVYRTANPEKSKIAAGLACGALWSVCKGINIGDFVLCPDGSGSYRVAKVTGNYIYTPGEILPHRRAVHWLPQSIDNSEMSDILRRSCGARGTLCDISVHQEEIERLLSNHNPPALIATDKSVEDPIAFPLEKHLEDFLVANWKQTELGQNYDIYEEDGECIGQQYSTDTGPIDILAISKDKRELLVVELKKGKASDVVVGQILRYMGYVTQELTEDGQKVKGVIIAQDDDQKLKLALSVVPNIAFYRYQVSFKLLSS